jgi:hypothetical protein
VLYIILKQEGFPHRTLHHWEQEEHNVYIILTYALLALKNTSFKIIYNTGILYCFAEVHNNVLAVEESIASMNNFQTSCYVKNEVAFSDKI